MIAICAMLSLGAFAANEALIASIKKANSVDYACTFDQTKILKGMKKSIDSKGTLYKQGTTNMSMQYSQPEGDMLVINANKFVMISRGKYLNHSIKEGAPTAKLRNTLLKCVWGDIDGLAAVTESNVEYTRNGNLDVFTFTRNGKGVTLYNKIVLSFDKTSHMIKQMEMYEASGSCTTYKWGTADTKKAIDKSVFEAPAK